MGVFVVGVLALFAYLTWPGFDAHAQTDEMRCGQEPGNRFYWVERAFCDLDVHGPEKAQGIVIWNHGIYGTLEQWRAPVPPAFRLLQARGWDVIAVKRHNLADDNADRSLSRSVQRTREEARAQRKLGYRQIVVAGQSFGGYISLEAADEAPDLFFAVVAMAPGVRSLSASGRLDASVTDRLLQRLKTERVVVVFPKDDALFGNIIRGESADRILAARRRPYLLFDETSSLSGHGGGTGGRFAFTYGMCLVEFLSAPEVPDGRYACSQSDDGWIVTHELLLRKGPPPELVRDTNSLPAEIGPLAGLWYGLLEDTIVLFALVRSGSGKLRVMYHWASSRVGKGVYDAVAQGGEVIAVFPSKARITVARSGEETMITWTSADGRRVLKTRLLRARDDPG